MTPAKKKPPGEPSLTSWAVVHQLRAGNTYHRRPRVIIEAVPERVGRKAIKAALDAAGYAAEFSEGGVAWANHRLLELTHWPETWSGSGAVQTVSWDALLVKQERRRLAVDLPPDVFAKVKLHAAASGQTVQAWCECVLAGAVD